SRISPQQPPIAGVVVPLDQRPPQPTQLGAGLYFGKKRVGVDNCTHNAPVMLVEVYRYAINQPLTALHQWQWAGQHGSSPQNNSLYLGPLILVARVVQADSAFVT